MRKLIAIAFVLVFASSCVSYNRCVRKYGRVQADTIMAPYQMDVPADSVRTLLQIDSIPFMVPGDTVYVESPENRARIRYWRDLYNNAIAIQADCDEVIIRDTLRVPFPVILDPPPPGRLARLSNTYRKVSAIMLPVLVLFIVSLIKLKR